MTWSMRLALLGALGAAGCSTYVRGAADPEGGPPMMGPDVPGFGPDLPAAADVTDAGFDVGFDVGFDAGFDVGVDAGGFSCMTFCERISNRSECTQAYAGCLNECAMNLTRDGGVFPEACRGELTTLFTCVANTSQVQCGAMEFPFPQCLADNGAAHQCIGMH